MKKKTVALLMASMLVVGVAAGGTMAWLTDADEPVVNTFTVGDIDIELTETTGTVKDDNSHNYKFVPGDTLAKDPKVTVKPKSEACYLFVKVEETNNYWGDNPSIQIIQWTFQDQTPVVNTNPTKGWVAYTPETSSADNTYYYYRIVDAETAAAGASWYLLTGQHDAGCSVDNTCKCEFANGYVAVNEKVTKEMATGSNSIKVNEPTLTFTAAAVQSENLTSGAYTSDDLMKVVAQLPEEFISD